MSQDQPGRPEPDEVESRLTDLHYAIFERLPDEGRSLSLRPMVVTVGHLREQLNALLQPGEPKLTSGMLMAELRTLTQVGLAVRVVNISGSTLGYQRTRRGAEIASAYKERVRAATSEPEPEPREPESEDGPEGQDEPTSERDVAAWVESRRTGGAYDHPER